MKPDTRQRFAGYDGQFKSVRHKVLFSPHVAKAIVNAARGRLLDIGTGDGYKLRRILDLCGAAVTGGVALEPSPLFRKAQEELAAYPSISVSNCPFEEFECNEPFDTVLLFEVIEHVPADMHHQMLAKILSHLAANGTVIISTPNRPVYRLKNWLLREAPDATHVSELGFCQLHALLSAHFEDIKYYGSLPWMGLVRALPPVAALNGLLNPVLITHAFYAVLREPCRESRT